MQAGTLINHLEEIVRELRIEDLVRFLAKFLSSQNAVGITQEEKKSFSDLMFASQVGYSSLMADPEREAILKNFGLPDLYESQKLLSMMTVFNSAPDSNYFHNMPSSCSSTPSSRLSALCKAPPKPLPASS